MNSDESFLTIRIFYKEKSFDINSKDIITLKEIKEKSLNILILVLFIKIKLNLLLKIMKMTMMIIYIYNKKMI